MPGVLELSVESADAMRALGAATASLLSGGDVIVLTGDLGAGKTTFVQGAPRGRHERLGRPGGRTVIVLGIDTATRQSSVALGTERGTSAQMALAVGRSHEEVVVPAIEHLLQWSGISLSQLGGIAVGIGP